MADIIHAADHVASRGPSAVARQRDPWVVRAMDRVSESLGLLAGLMILAAALLITWAITTRAIGHTAIWQLEAAIYLLIYVTFLGAGYGLKVHAHVRLDSLVNTLPRTPRFVLTILVDVAVLALVVFVAIKGLGITTEAYETGQTSGTAWNIPKYVPYSALPVGMTLLAGQYLVTMYRTFIDWRNPGSDDAEAAYAGEHWGA